MAKPSKLLPLDPTESMKLEGARAIGKTMGWANHTERAQSCYQEMTRVAPKCKETVLLPVEPSLEVLNVMAYHCGSNTYAARKCYAALVSTLKHLEHMADISTKV